MKSAMWDPKLDFAHRKEMSKGQNLKRSIDYLIVLFLR